MTFGSLIIRRSYSLANRFASVQIGSLYLLLYVLKKKIMSIDHRCMRPEARRTWLAKFACVIIAKFTCVLTVLLERLKLVTKTKNVGLKARTTRWRALCSTNWARLITAFQQNRWNTTELGAKICGAELGATSAPWRSGVPAQHVPRRHSRCH
jgi:hypothetical protein